MLFIASYYRQHSFKFNYSYFNTRRKLLMLHHTKHNFSVKMRTSSNPADINSFLSQTGKVINYATYLQLQSKLLNQVTGGKLGGKIDF